jgi:hypothetical protein
VAKTHHGDLIRESDRGFRWERFVLSEWTTLIFLSGY